MSTPRNRLLRRHPAGVSGDVLTGLVAWHDYYDPTTALTSVTDKSGLGNTLQLGSTAGADDNDPAWVALGKGLSFATDDYCVRANGLAASTGLTYVYCGKFDFGADTRIMSQGNSTDNTPSVTFGGASDGSGKLRLFVRDAVGTTTGFNGTTIPNAALYHCAIATADAAGVTLFIDGANDPCDAGAPVSVPLASLDLFMVGALARGTPVQFMTGIALRTRVYSRALTTMEKIRVYRASKSYWAGLGVTIL